MPLLAVERLVDDIAGIRQRLGDLAVELLVILDDEYPHFWRILLAGRDQKWTKTGNMESAGYLTVRLNWRARRIPAAWDGRHPCREPAPRPRRPAARPGPTPAHWPAVRHSARRSAGRCHSNPPPRPA